MVLFIKQYMKSWQQQKRSRRYWKTLVSLLNSVGGVLNLCVHIMCTAQSPQNVRILGSRIPRKVLESEGGLSLKSFWESIKGYWFSLKSYWGSLKRYEATLEHKWGCIGQFQREWGRFNLSLIKIKCFAFQNVDTAYLLSEEGWQNLDLDPRKDDAFCGLCS